MKMLNLRSPQAVYVYFAAVLGIAAIGCVPNATNTSNVAVSPANAANQSPAANTNVSSAPSKDLSRVPVTLPMMDALLADDESVNELRSRTQVTDEQIQKLRDAGRDAVLQLSETGDADDSGRSTAAASKKALDKIKEIVGPEKADSVANFLREKWVGGSTDLAATPNSIPTDTRIVVNAPAYRMDVFRDGKMTKSYKVGIGYPEFPLPSGLRKATEIIFNPTWTPPDEPWVKGKFAPGKKVEAGSSDNPLGPIKIPIGLPSLIHGGKNPARLGNFASHGCVGLTNAQIQDFAVELSGLAGDPISMDEVKGYQNNKTETKDVKLENAVPVELRYETIVVTDDGKLTIYRDVYERGTNTEENLRRVLDAVGVSFDTLPAADQEKIRDGLKQMAIDATGDPVDPEDSNQNAKAGKDDKKGDKVTRNVKGKREVAFEISALRGKGYPVPVNLKSA